MFTQKMLDDMERLSKSMNRVTNVYVACVFLFAVAMLWFFIFDLKVLG